MERSRSLSREEENELAISTKKVKDSHNVTTDGSLARHGTLPTKLSFKDKLVGEVPGTYSQAFAFSDSMDAESELDEETEDIREGFAAIRLSKETKQRIRAPWAKAIIVRVIKKTVGYNYLHAKFLGLWKPAGRIDMVDLGRDFFLLRFSLLEDLEQVLRKGPWFIGEHFLSIQKWEANFKPSKAQVNLMAVWVRLHELPIEYYDAEVLKQLGRALGTVLRADTFIATEARGRYACICVQVDVSKPLVTSVCVGQRHQAVVYEGVSKLCFSCGRLGHWSETCPYTIKPSALFAKESHVPGDVEKADHMASDLVALFETQTKA